jgi:hypothetical protein
MEWYLPLIWAGLLGIAVAMYVILDGFDLGVGILFPFARSETERDQMMRSVAPFWDGNETWLVLGGGGLLAAFPAAYAVIMPALYLPVIAMLLALVFRGVALEFRHISRSKTWLNVAFTVGSGLAAFSQGVILGGLVQGIPVRDGAYAGGPFDWATPFCLLTGLAIIAGYALLGACWLTMKTEGPVAVRARSRQDSAAGGAGLHGCGEPVDSARPAAHRRALVLFAKLLFPVAGAADDRAHRLRPPALARGGTRRAALLCRDRSIPARLSRPGDFRFSLSGAALAHCLGNGGRALKPDLPPARHLAAAADGRGLHRFRVLAVPRQSARGRELSLTIFRTFRPQHRPAEPDERKKALHGSRERARHFRH